MKPNEESVELLKQLSAPMPYQWRVQESKSWGSMVVPYIDARDVMDRLDEVVGPENWQADYKQIKQAVYCGIGIRFQQKVTLDDYWVWKWDAGSESNIEKEKGEASDSFKRAAIKWGVGRFLYDLSTYKIKSVATEKKNGKGEVIYAPAGADGKPIYDKRALSQYVNALRGVKPPPPPPKPQLLLDTDLYREAESYVRKAAFTIPQIEKKYALSKEVKDALAKAQKEGIRKIEDLGAGRPGDEVDLTVVQVDTDSGEIIK